MFVESYFFLVILTSLLHLSMECRFTFKYHLRSECVLLDTFSQAWIEKANRCESSCHSFRKYILQSRRCLNPWTFWLSPATFEFGDTDPPQKRVEGLPSLLLVLSECTPGQQKIQRHRIITQASTNLCGGRCFPSTGRRAILKGDAGEKKMFLTFYQYGILGAQPFHGNGRP